MDEHREYQARLHSLALACRDLGLEPHWVLCRTRGPNRKAPQAGAWQRTAAPWAAVGVHKGLVGLVPTSIGCAVVDVDEGGTEAVDAVRAYIGWQPIAEHETPGGWHIWYRASGATPKGNARWTLPKGSGDIRAGKGFVVLWRPDCVAEALRERWEDGHPVIVELPKPAPARASPGQPEPAPRAREPAGPRTREPANARERPRDPAGLADPYIASAVDAEIAEIAAVGKGGRNEALNKAAFSLGQLCAAGPDADLVLGKLHHAATAAGLPEHESGPTIKSGWAAGAKSPRERPRAPAQAASPRQPPPAPASPAKPREGPRAVEPEDVDPSHAPDKHAPGLAHALSELGVDMRLDIRAARTEYRREGADWAPITDTAAAALRQEIADGFWYRRSDGKRARLRFGPDAWQEATLALLDSRRVDPWAEWLHHLPPVQGDEGLLDNWLAELFQVTHNTALHQWASRYLFLAPVQRTLSPGCQLDEVPVLLGPQGIGKSSVLREMFPAEPPGWQDRLYGGRLSLDDDPKKQVEALLGRVVVEIAELTGIRDQRRLDAMKTFITLRDDGDIRLSFARNPEPRPRRCAFVGTSNPRPHGILPNDPSGNRRWVVVELNAPEGPVEDYMAEHRKRLWSEALERYTAGERANLPRALADMAAEYAEAHRYRDPIEDDLDEALGKRFGAGPLTYSELQQLMGQDKALDARTKRRLAEALQARGWAKHRGHSGRGFMPPGDLLAQRDA